MGQYSHVLGVDGGFTVLPAAPEPPLPTPMNANGPVGSVPWSHIPEAVMWGIMVLAWVAGLVPSEIKGQWCDLGRPYILLGSSDWPGGAWVQAGIWAV